MGQSPIHRASFSDRRLKTDIRIIENLPTNKQIGVIAQELEKVLPELVTEAHDGIKKVDYSSMTAFLVQVNKEQQLKIESQEAKIEYMLQRQDFLIKFLLGLCIFFMLILLVIVFEYYTKRGNAGRK